MSKFKQPSQKNSLVLKRGLLGGEEVESLLGLDALRGVLIIRGETSRVGRLGRVARGIGLLLDRKEEEKSL